MSCPNCGAHLDVETFLAPPDPETYAPPQVHVDGHWVAAERWVVARCVGLRMVDDHDRLSPPCGYLRWEHRVARPWFPLVPTGRVVDAGGGHVDVLVDRDLPSYPEPGTAVYSQPAWTPGQSWATEDLTDEQLDHVARVARHVRETEGVESATDRIADGRGPGFPPLRQVDRG